MTTVLTNKLAVKYAHLRDVESMRAIARAHQERNLANFEKALFDYKLGSWPSFFFDCSILISYFRALIRPNNPFTSRSIIWYPPWTEPPTDHWTLLRCWNFSRSIVSGSRSTSCRSQVRFRFMLSLPLADPSWCAFDIGCRRWSWIKCSMVSLIRDEDVYWPLTSLKWTWVYYLSTP